MHILHRTYIKSQLFNQNPAFLNVKPAIRLQILHKLKFNQHMCQEQCN
jgi:hypothetical protein